MKKIKINLDYELRDIVICALRYAIGRHTYIVDEVCHWIEMHPEILDDRMVSVMCKDVDEQLTYYEEHGVDAISEIDYNRLKSFRLWLQTYYIKD